MQTDIQAVTPIYRYECQSGGELFFSSNFDKKTEVTDWTIIRWNKFKACLFLEEV